MFWSKCNCTDGKGKVKKRPRYSMVMAMANFKVVANKRN